VDVALEDQVGDQRRVEQDFDCGDAAIGALARDQALRDERLQVQRQIHQQLCAAFFGKEVDDAVERLVGAVGVQRRQAEVTGFGEGDRVFHGFAVADLADQDDIGRLAQRVLQRREPVVGVDADLALGDDGFPVLVHVFDRVFDRDDVVGGIFVAMPDHGGERGRFSRAGGADKNHQAALDHCDVTQNRWQVQGFHLRNFGVDGPHHDPYAALLHEHVDAEAADFGRADRKVGFVGRLEVLPLPVVHDRVRQFAGMRGRQRLVRHRSDLAVHLDGGRKPCGKEQVGGVLRQHQTQQVVDGFFSVHRSILNPEKRLCSVPCCAPRRRQRCCVSPGPAGTGQASACPGFRPSGSTNTSAPPCLRGSGCGSPGCRS